MSTTETKGRGCGTSDAQSSAGARRRRGSRARSPWCLLRQATLLLRPRVEALRAAAFDPKSREIAAELTLLRSTRAALKIARGFMGDRPADTDLARQLVNKSVRGLEA